MGNMLMVMMPSLYTLITVKIISMFFSGVIFILFIMLQSEIKPDSFKAKNVIILEANFDVFDNRSCSCVHSN